MCSMCSNRNDFEYGFCNLDTGHWALDSLDSGLWMLRPESLCSTAKSSTNYCTRSLISSRNNTNTAATLDGELGTGMWVTLNWQPETSQQQVELPVSNLAGDVDIANKIWPGHVMGPATVKTSQWQKYHIIHNFIAAQGELKGQGQGAGARGLWELSCWTWPRKSLGSSVECLLK